MVMGWLIACVFTGGVLAGLLLMLLVVSCLARKPSEEEWQALLRRAAREHDERERKLE